MYLTKSVGILLMSSWVVIVILCFILYCDNLSFIRSFNTRWLYSEEIAADYYNGTEDYLIKTEGCYIPNYGKTLLFKEADEVNTNCGLRAIFVDKDGDNITFQIDEELMKVHHKQKKAKYTCCYRFVSRLTTPGREETGVSLISKLQSYDGNLNTAILRWQSQDCRWPSQNCAILRWQSEDCAILCWQSQDCNITMAMSRLQSYDGNLKIARYSPCKKFHNGTTIKLKEEVIDVSCSTVSYKRTKSVIIYEDAYMLVKKNQLDRPYNEDNQEHWNVLVLGMDTMSRARLISSMPDTFTFFNKHGWLDYKGYQKVGYNTFPNIMAFLTGRKMSSVYLKCAKSMSNCNEYMIWSKYKDVGYATAFGEDYLRLPDTFTPYHGFRAPPTTHYMRPLYLTGETRKGNLVCTKQVPSATSALSYALDFVETYKNDKFFGLFWINSFSHNLDSLPTLLDKDIIDFIEKLNATGALSNTFILFTSDHGIRYGKMRLPVESYYEERLPMFFMWTPTNFQKSHPSAYHNLKINQNRLTTPYDLHETFRSILQLSSGVVTGERSEACPTCTSLFEVKPVHRTCASANVDEKWCSCRNLTYLDKKTDEYGAVRSINLAVSYIQNLTKNIKTTNCTKCYLLQFNKVLRAHKQVDYVDNLTNYVIAFEMSPGNLAYEAFVQKDQKGFHLLQPTQTISQYNIQGACVLNPNDRAFCVCKTLAKCN